MSVSEAVSSVRIFRATQFYYQIIFCLRLTYQLVLIFGVKMTALLDTTCADRILKGVYSMWSHIILQPVKFTNTLAFSIYFSCSLVRNLNHLLLTLIKFTTDVNGGCQVLIVAICPKEKK